MLLWEGQKGRVDIPFSKLGQGAPPFEALLALPLECGANEIAESGGLNYACQNGKHNYRHFCS